MLSSILVTISASVVLAVKLFFSIITTHLGIMMFGLVLTMALVGVWLYRLNEELLAFRLDPKTKSSDKARDQGSQTTPRVPLNALRAFTVMADFSASGAQTATCRKLVVLKRFCDGLSFAAAVTRLLGERAPMENVYLIFRATLCVATEIDKASTESPFVSVVISEPGTDVSLPCVSTSGSADMCVLSSNDPVKLSRCIVWLYVV